MKRATSACANFLEVMANMILINFEENSSFIIIYNLNCTGDNLLI